MTIGGGRQWARFAVIGIGTLVGPLDSAVNIAFPDITQSFAIPIPSIQWVIICYVLTYASLMLVFGRLGDQFGHLRVFQVGLGICAVAFLLCASARQFEWLLAFRVIQGVGTAMVISCGPALVTGLFDEAKRPRVLGTYTMVFGIGSAVGPSLGGLMVDAWGWPTVFWFRLPLALVALGLALGLRIERPPAADKRFDFLGALLLAGALSLLLLTINQAQSSAFGLEVKLALAVATVVVFAGFIFQERRAEAPIIDLGAFRHIDLALVNLTNVAVNLAGFSVMLLVPYFLVMATDLPLAISGTVLAAGPLGMIVAAQVGGQLANRIGANRLGLCGAVLVGLGVLTISSWTEGQAPGFMIAVLVVHGAGLGLFQVASLDLVIAQLPRANRGVAGSLVMVTRTIGIVLAASLLMLLFVSFENAATAAGAETPFLFGFQSTFQFTGLALLAFLGLTCLRPRLWFGRTGTSI